MFFEFKETKSLLERRELSAEMIGARKWWSIFEGLCSWPGRGLCQKLMLFA
jgi:hypothetical protein